MKELESELEVNNHTCTIMHTYTHTQYNKHSCTRVCDYQKSSVSISVQRLQNEISALQTTQAETTESLTSLSAEKEVRVVLVFLSYCFLNSCPVTPPPAAYG